MTVDVCTCSDPGCPRDHAGLSDTPPLDELHQVEPEAIDAPPTPVTVAGPVAVDVLPTVWGGAKTYALAAAGAGVVGQKIAGDDPRRACLIVAVSGAGDVLLAGTRSGVELGQGFRLTAGMGPLRLTMAGEVYAAAVAAAATLSVLSEQWSR